MSGLDSCPKWNNAAGHVCGSSDVPGGLSPLFNGLSPTLLTISDAFPGIISQLNSAHSTSLPSCGALACGHRGRSEAVTH